MSVEDNSSPAFGLNHPFNTGLGIPIARASDDAQGTLTLLFQEVKTGDGDPSDTILALTTSANLCKPDLPRYDPVWPGMGPPGLVEFARSGGGISRC